MATTNHLILLVFLALTLLVHAKIYLHTSDHYTLTTILQNLGVPSDILPENLCNIAGISCYRKLLNNSDTLKVTKIAFENRRLKGAISPMIGKLLEKLSLEKVPVSLRSFHNLRFLANTSGNNLVGPLLELNMLESVNTKRFPMRYIFAETTNGSSSQGTVQAPAHALMEVPIRKHKRSNRKKKIGWVLGFLVGSFAGVVSAMIFSVLLNIVVTMVKIRGNCLTIFSESIKAEELAFLDDDDDAVAGLTIIGRGGCSYVYKTDIPNEKIKTIAIKKIIQPSKGTTELVAEETKNLSKKMRQIRSEIQTAGQLRHRNLVSLLAHVSRPNCHYLVYEFLKNGSLQDIIGQVWDRERQLEWPARHKIAIGVASGLEYLHMSHTTRILHRDIKPANVLLDDDMEARITDFGLARLIPDTNTHMTSPGVVEGTLGYIAPEHHQTFRYNDKCDIYAFGVLLGVLVMGKLPSDEFFQHTNEKNSVKWMRNVLTSDNPSQVFDSSLLGNGFEEQMFLVLKIACFCTLDNPQERPNSKDCKAMLTQIEY